MLTSTSMDFLWINTDHAEMARYDVYMAPGNQGFVLHGQSDLLEGLNTRVVVPLMLADTAPKLVERLNPVFQIDGKAT